MDSSDTQMLEIFRALADPNRLQLFMLLLESDRTNSELMEATGLRQNLLSHHLNILAACGLVRPHRSIGDARRHYYSPRLETVRACQRWWAAYCPALATPAPPLQPKRRVLFLCLRNGARSFMAEGVARHLAAHLLEPYSAGIEPGTPDLLALGAQVLAERGVPPFDFTMKTLDALAGQHFDLLITVCDIVHEVGLPPNLADRQIHWSLPDPLEQAPDPAGQLAAVRALYDELEQRLACLLPRLLPRSAS